MNVSAIIVTRGDVDLTEILDSLPVEWERLVWNNGVPTGIHYKDGNDWRPDGFAGPVADFSVYGRYAAIEYASHELIYVQDDDVLVSDPQAIVDEWVRGSRANAEPGGMRALAGFTDEALVANMPQEFRHDGYTDSCLVGFGACFHRDAPFRAFDRFGDANGNVIEFSDTPMWQRTCDVVFTALTPRVIVEVPKTNLPWAEDYSRMYRQPNHTTERMQMLELARQVRDA